MLVRRLPAVLLLLVLSVAVAHAQPSAQRTSFPLLRLEAAARPAALGGAYTAVADGDVNALFYNPAIPGPATSGTASLSYLNHLADVNAGTIAYTHTARGLGTTFSGAVRFVHWGEFDGRDAFGVDTGTFRAGDVALTLGASRAFGPRIRYGGALHVIYASIADASASALAGDVGVLYRLPARQLRVAASLRQVGTALSSFGARDEQLPADLQLGISKRLAHLPLLLSVTGYDLTHLGEGIEGGSTTDNVLAHIAFGSELQLGEAFRIRAGYNHRRSQELALNDRLDAAGLSLGFGLHVSRVSVDYAYSSWSDLGGLHQFTVRLHR